MRLFSRREGGEVPRFERLVIEPSGLSDPAPIAQAILRNPVLSRAFRLEAIGTAVDALFGEMQLARHAETRKQVALADCLVLTKTDVASVGAVDRLRAELRVHNPAAPILVGSRGEVDAAALFPPSFFDPALGGGRSVLFADSVDPGHAERYAAASLVAGQPLRWRAFEAWPRGLRIGMRTSFCGSKACWISRASMVRLSCRACIMW